jgi:Tol biopolymer transport system component
MTTFDRFDPFERRIAEAIDEIAPTRLPDYLDDVFRQTARTAQRPRWTFLERWLPVDTALARPGPAPRLALRPLLVLALVGLVAAAALAIAAGSRPRVPAPFGPAKNGQLVYTNGQDLMVRNGLTGDARLLVGGTGVQAYASFSPDGQQLAYVSTYANKDHFTIAKADGSDSRVVALIPPTGNAQAAWRPDSRAMALVFDVDGKPTLRLVFVDGSPDKVVDLTGLLPQDVSWQPPDGKTLLVRGHDVGDRLYLFTVNPDGTDLTSFNLPGTSAFGREYTLSGSTWSPDGTTVAYNSIQEYKKQDGKLVLTKSHFRVHLIAADGTNDRAVQNPPDDTIQEAWPLFSPDGKWIVVHRWVFKEDSPTAEGWLAVMPADGSAPARDIGPRISGGEDTGLSKLWSPDGTRILMGTANSRQVFSIDPVSGDYETLPWVNELPDWQRVAP